MTKKEQNKILAQLSITEWLDQIYATAVRLAKKQKLKERKAKQKR